MQRRRRAGRRKSRVAQLVAGRPTSMAQGTKGAQQCVQQRNPQCAAVTTSHGLIRLPPHTHILSFSLSLHRRGSKERALVSMTRRQGHQHEQLLCRRRAAAWDAASAPLNSSTGEQGGRGT